MTRPTRLAHWCGPTLPPLLDTTVGDVLRSAAAGYPERVALIDGCTDPSRRRSWTFKELLEGSQAVAGALAARFHPGERVAVWAPNTPEWVFLDYAVALAGLVLVPVNPAYKPDEAAHVLRDSRTAGLFVARSWRDNPIAEHVGSLRPELPELRYVTLLEALEDLSGGPASGAHLPTVRPDDVVQVQYTSGTTGAAKGVVLSHRGITNNARLWAGGIGLAESSVYIGVMPLFHSAGCIDGILGTAAHGATLVNVEAFDAALVLELIEAYGGTHLLAVPTMLVSLLEQLARTPRDVTSLVAVPSGGATVPVELVDRAEAALGAELLICYGQTEAGCSATLVPRGAAAQDKANTVGVLLPHTEAKVVDRSNGQMLPFGTEGELCLRGYFVMHGYLGQPELTAQAIDGNGWLHTGDLVTMDDRGFVTITGRLKDVIIRGGENMSPREIEEMLLSHPAVAEVAVVGLPDQRWGEVVAAFVRDADPNAPATDDELGAFIRARLAPHKAPTVWVHLESLPRTSTGKVQKFALVDAWSTRAVVSPSPPNKRPGPGADHRRPAG